MAQRTFNDSDNLVATITMKNGDLYHNRDIGTAMNPTVYCFWNGNSMRVVSMADVKHIDIHVKHVQTEAEMEKALYVSPEKQDENDAKNVAIQRAKSKAK